MGSGRPGSAARIVFLRILCHADARRHSGARGRGRPACGISDPHQFRPESDLSHCALLWIGAVHHSAQLTRVDSGNDFHLEHYQLPLIKLVLFGLKDAELTTIRLI